MALTVQRGYRVGQFGKKMPVQFKDHQWFI